MNKEERRIIAESHNEEMISNHKPEINYCINNSTLFIQPLNVIPMFESTTKPSISVVDLTTEEAILKYSNTIDSVALNFASNTRAGGGFIKGAIAQEEALCHSSYLYNVLSAFNEHYNQNYYTKKGGVLYYDWAIYSPDIQFTKGKISRLVNVITCPAPNYERYECYFKNQPRWYERYLDALNSRIEYILDIAEIKCQKSLILGAFGCGVFGNEPTLVATIFKEKLSNPKYHFSEVIFAIPKGINHDKFKEVFG